MPIPIDFEKDCYVSGIIYGDKKNPHNMMIVVGKFKEVLSKKFHHSRILKLNLNKNATNSINSTKAEANTLNIPECDIFGFTFGGVWLLNPTFKKPKWIHMMGGQIGLLEYVAIHQI